jgi:tetratricopeptide (TPR) repeat protein
VQDAAYRTLLREPRRALHARIAETLESQFVEMAESQPELLARHCTEAALIEKAVGLWGKAAQRSMERSALMEAVEQFKRALDQIATLPSTPALRRMQINLQVALITPLNYVNGWAAPETKAAVERARLLLEQAEALGEPPEDPLLLFSVLIGVWSANFVAFNGDVSRDLAAQMLALAEKQKASFHHRRDQQGSAMVGRNLLGAALLLRGEIAEARTHFDQAAETRRERGRRMAHYDPAELRPLATRFREDPGVAILHFRSKALWLLGHPAAALTDIDQALKYARESAFTVSRALSASFFFVDSYCGNYTTVNARLDELIPLADEKDAPLFRAFGMLGRGWLLGVTGRAADAVQMITSGIRRMAVNGSNNALAVVVIIFGGSSFRAWPTR